MHEMDEIEEFLSTFSRLLLEDKISLRLPHCTRLYTFESRSSGPFLSARKSLKTAIDQIQTNMSKPPKKVDIDTLASGKTNYHSKIKET